MKRLLLLIGSLVALVVAMPTSAHAGGWTVVSLDSMPVVVAGEPAEIGFTVLRHGVTPETSDDLSVVLVGADGSRSAFDAVPEGAVGHHVATVTIPEAGSFRWSVEGEFVGAELGLLEVTAGGTSGPSWGWDALQWGGTGLAVALAALAVTESMRSRRQRTVAASTAA